MKFKTLLVCFAIITILFAQIVLAAPGLGSPCGGKYGVCDTGPRGPCGSLLSCNTPCAGSSTGMCCNFGYGNNSPCSSGCPVAHCWDFGAYTTTNPNINVSGCYAATAIQQGGTNYTLFGTPGVKVEATGFGSYNYVCDDGAATSSLAFGGLMIDGNSTNFITNSTSITPIGTGRNLCTLSNGCKQKSSLNAGAGDLNKISYIFSAPGGHSYELRIASPPYVKGVMPTNYIIEKRENIYIGYPSLIVSGQSDLNEGFFEKFGSYTKPVVFTLINKSPLDVNLKNYNIRCTGSNIHCSVDKTYVGWTIQDFNGKMVIRGEVSVDKNSLPLTGSVWLEVNYTAPLLNTPECNSFFDNNTISKPVTYRFGLMDMQKFQIGMKANYDYTGCIGEDGMIGMTGAGYAPRINLGFGGSANSQNELVSMDECDVETLDDSTKANGLANDDWVYCSQKELLVELARKIGKMWVIDVNKFSNPSLTRTEIQNRKNPYAGTQMYIRSQSLNPAGINSSIDLLGSNFSQILTNSGLPRNNFVNFSTTPSVVVTQMKNLYNAADITFQRGQSTGTIRAGLYAVNIEVEINPSASQQTLFLQNNSVNPAATIKIDFTRVSDPTFNWFFYDYGNLEIDKNINTAQLSFEETNTINRGTLLTITHDPSNPNFSNNKFYPTYVNTLVARIKSNSAGNADTNFALMGMGGYNYSNFSYWTGFASSLGSGCSDIDDEGLGTLPYRQPDFKVENLVYTYDFNNYKKSKPNGTIYLQSILFWPKDYSNNITIIAPFGLMIDSNWFDGSISSPVAGKRINTENPRYRVFDLEELIMGIRMENVCVNTTLTANRTAKWTIFWNQTKILDTISQKKRDLVTTNADAQLCTTREILGG